MTQTRLYSTQTRKNRVGFVSCSRVVSNFASPNLTDLLKKERKWEWDAECQAAFQKLKDAITSELVLRLLNLELPFEVHTDASDKALGGVLVQERHPIAFKSRKLDAQSKGTTPTKKVVRLLCL